MKEVELEDAIRKGQIQKAEKLSDNIAMQRHLAELEKARRKMYSYQAQEQMKTKKPAPKWGYVIKYLRF